MFSYYILEYYKTEVCSYDPSTITHTVYVISAIHFSSTMQLTAKQINHQKEIKSVQTAVLDPKN